MSRPGSDQNVGVTAEREPAPVSCRPPAPQSGGLTRRRRPAAGLRPTERFAIAGPLTVAWVAFSIWVSDPWRDDLEQALGPVLAWVIPVMLAYIPGVVIGFLIATLLVSRYREPMLDPPQRDLARGRVASGHGRHRGVERGGRDRPDARADRRTSLRGAARGRARRQQLDRPHRRARGGRCGRLGPRLPPCFRAPAGKASRAEHGAPSVTTPIVVTVDADTYLQREALTYLVAASTSTPQDQHVSACAGALVAENPTTNFMTRMQQWDYRLGINGVKRMQAAYNSALVAQGAFSAYWARGPPRCRRLAGRDRRGHRPHLDADGLARRRPVRAGRTRLHRRAREARPLHAPTVALGARHVRRARRATRRRTQPRVLAKFVAGIDYLVPFLDIGFIFFWVPGVILFLFGYPLIFGWWSMLLLPITLVDLRPAAPLAGTARLPPPGHPPRARPRGFIGYLFVYQVLTSAASLRGYTQYALGGRRWNNTGPPPGRNAMLRGPPEWRGPESNRRHHGFQPCALPTELPRRAVKRVPA